MLVKCSPTTDDIEPPKNKYTNLASDAPTSIMLALATAILKNVFPDEYTLNTPLELPKNPIGEVMLVAAIVYEFIVNPKVELPELYIFKVELN